MTTLPPVNGQRAAAQKFLEEHDFLWTENDDLKKENEWLQSDNQNLLAEVNMLREELARADKDRTKLQGFASSLVVRLQVIQTTINDASREAIAQGVEASRNVIEKRAIEEPSKVVLSTTIEGIESALQSALKLPAPTI